MMHQRGCGSGRKRRQVNAEVLQPELLTQLALRSSCDDRCELRRIDRFPAGRLHGSGWYWFSGHVDLQALYPRDNPPVTARYVEVRTRTQRKGAPSRRQPIPVPDGCSDVRTWCSIKTRIWQAG